MTDTHHPRVLFLINSFVVGGAERVFISDINELYRQGWDVHAAVLFTPGELASKLAPPPERFYTLGFDSLWDIRGLVRLIKLIKKEHVDVLYTTLNEANLVGRLARLFVPSIRLYTREANMADVKGPVHKLADIFIGLVSKRIVVVSHAVGRSVAAYAPWLCSRTVTLYNGASMPEVPIAREYHANALKLLSVGSLTEKKDHMVLIKALALLPSTTTLTINGEGALYDTLSALAQEEGVGSRVAFVGHESRDRDKLYGGHDIFVLPSQREGCPNVVSTAQSFALPVVAFDIPGMREFVPEGAGVLVAERSPRALAEAIKNLSASPAAMRLMGEEGFRAVNKTRSMEAHIDKLKAILSDTAPAV